MTGRTPRAVTALSKYARLESQGLWRETTTAQRREVVVAFREATLVLSDPKKDLALSHWSLPAIERLNPGEMPALFGPGSDASETLEIEDDEMIKALEMVRGALKARQPKPGRLRGILLTSGTALVVGLGVFWLPDALLRHTATVLPAATRQAIGRAALEDVQRLTGSPCASPLGTYALTELGDKLFGQHNAQILIMREGVETATHLPGGVILIGRRMIEDMNGPEVLAGLAIMERLRAETRDPMLPILRHAGLLSTLRLLTSGTLPNGVLAGYGEAILRETPVAIAADDALDRFRDAGVTSSPYAYMIDPNGISTQALIANDPLKGLIPIPLMPDGDWVSLQEICS
jgi:hypothetical protein